MRVLQQAREPIFADALDVRRIGRIFVGQDESLALLRAEDEAAERAERERAIAELLREMDDSGGAD